MLYIGSETLIRSHGPKRFSQFAVTQDEIYNSSGPLENRVVRCVGFRRFSNGREALNWDSMKLISCSQLRTLQSVSP